MSRPAKVTESDAGCRRLPPQASQAVLTMYCATRRFIIALWELAKVCSTYRRAPINVPM
jgi:hypothetical protein